MAIVQIIVVVILFIITWIVIGCNSCACPSPNFPHATDYYTRQDWELRVAKLEAENRRLDFMMQSIERNKRCFQENYSAHCVWCQKNFYAKTPNEQKTADLLKGINKNVNELAEKLDVKITTL